MQYRKKPVVIEAIQLTESTMMDICRWINEKGGEVKKWVWNVNERYLTIGTLEGDHKANEGDWIIRGIKGEFYPCKPDIFRDTYESAN